MARLGKIFIRGLLGVLPISISIYLIIWIFETFERLVSNLVYKGLFPELNIPGLGIITGICFIFLVGLLLSSPYFTKIYEVVQFPFKNLPFVRSVYNAIEDLMGLFNPPKEMEKSKVVRVKMEGQGISLIGLVTQEKISKIINSDNESDLVAVFIPLSYALGGYTIMAERKCLEVLDVKVETFMRLALTAWIKK